MTWQREFGSQQLKSYDYVIAAILVFFLIGILFQHAIAFIAVGLFIVFALIYRKYDKDIVKKLVLQNPKKTIKLFPGDEAKLTLELENRSIFPFVNGEMNLQAGSAVKAYDHVTNEKKYWKTIHFPLSILRRKKTIIELPVRAEHRGVAKINDITLIFPHLFNFDRVTMKYRKFYYTEYIVLPELLPVQGVEAGFHMMPGSGYAAFSPFEDVQSPRGTRDYSYSDPFQRINWNASVKAQKLQTNVYEKMVDRSFVFIVNIGQQNHLNMSAFNKNMERLLSYTAYLCHYATEKDVPFEIFLNTRKPGKVPYIHLPEGAGQMHYGHALEMLARVHKQTMIVPFNQMLHRLGKHFYKPKTIVIIGEVPSGTAELMKSWKQAKHSVFHISDAGDEAIVRPLTRDGRMSNAK
ncbi:DUF58 domain-containing protein [Virgibacillus kimchii]